LKGARELEDQLLRQRGKLKALGEDYSEVDAKIKKVQESIARAGKPEGPGMGEMFNKIPEGLGEIIPGFAQLDGFLSKFAGGALGAVAGVFAALATGVETAKHALEEFAVAERNVSKLDAALAQTGHLTDEYRERLQELAEEMQSATA